MSILYSYTENSNIYKRPLEIFWAFVYNYLDKIMKL